MIGTTQKIRGRPRIKEKLTHEGRKVNSYKKNQDDNLNKKAEAKEEEKVHGQPENNQTIDQNEPFYVKHKKIVKEDKDSLKSSSKHERKRCKERNEDEEKV